MRLGAAALALAFSPHAARARACPTFGTRERKEKKKTAVQDTLVLWAAGDY